MSQYIPGLVDYIPQIQPYKPDLNFFQQVLETKQAQYKAGYDRISSLYGELLDSPMLRNENVELRNKFFNDISASISKISSLDLSLNQNIEAAERVFQPLIDNDYILKDMAYTKKAYDALSRADSFKNCTDEKKCGGKYWEGGKRLIQYQMEEFANSSAEESLNYISPEYVPYVNIPKQAMEFAKEMGFNTKIPSFTADGRYQVMTKNGPAMVPSLTNAFVAAFQNDQSAVDYYNAKASLDRYDWSYQNAEQYGSKEAAENFYLDQMAKDLFTSNEKKEKQAEKERDEARTGKGAAEQIIKSKGVNPDDPDDQKLIADFNQKMVDELIASAAKDHYAVTKEAVTPETIGIVDLMSKRARVDSAVANSLFQTDLYNAADSYANLTFEQEIKADPYSLAGYEHSLALARMEKQFEYDVKLDDIRTTNEILKQGYKDNPLGVSLDPGSENYESEPASPGGAAEAPDLQKSDQSVLDTTLGELTAQLTGGEENDRGVMTHINTFLNGVINTPDGQSYKNIYINEDLRNWAKAKQEYLFNKAGGTEIYYTEKKNVTSKVLPFQEDPKVYQKVFANIFSFDEKVPMEKNLPGGYLNPDGTLVDKPHTRLDYTDPNGNNSWWKLGDRMVDFVENDPIARAFLKDDDVIKDKYKKYKTAKNNYDAIEQTRKNNVITTHKTALNTASGLVYDAINPEHSRRMLEEGFQKNGYVINKNAFVEEYVRNRPIRQAPSTGNPVADQIMYSRNVYASQVEEERYRDEAEDLYDRFSEMYKAIYNNLDTAPVKNKDYKPLQLSLKRDVSDGGAGVQANPLSVRNIDSAHLGSLGARDYRDVYKDFLRASMSDPDKVFIVGKDARELTEDNFDDYDDYTAANELTKANRKALQLIYNHLNNPTIKDKDAKRARLDAFTIHPIAINDDKKVAFTIKLNSEFFTGNQGGKNTPGALKGADDVISIVMDSENITADAYKRLFKGRVQTHIDAYGFYNIDQYSDHGGFAKITPATGGGFLIDGYTKIIDPETGEYVNKKLYDITRIDASVDDIASETNALLKQISNVNIPMHEYLTMSKRENDPSKLVKR